MARLYDRFQRREWGSDTAAGACTGLIGTALGQQSLRGVLSLCNARQMPRSGVRACRDALLEGRLTGVLVAFGGEPVQGPLL
jgi:NAD(P)H-dependent FMN reductase